ncbi:hypothetical protein D3C73_1441570 [compost metagenome]
MRLVTPAINRNLNVLPITSIPERATQMPSSPTPIIGTSIGVSVRAIVLVNSPKSRSAIAPKYRAYPIYRQDKTPPMNLPNTDSSIPYRFFPGRRVCSRA